MFFWNLEINALYVTEWKYVNSRNISMTIGNALSMHQLRIFLLRTGVRLCLKKKETGHMFVFQHLCFSNVDMCFFIKRDFLMTFCPSSWLTFFPESLSHFQPNLVQIILTEKMLNFRERDWSLFQKEDDIKIVRIGYVT